jgi:hypothetical protein
VWKCQTDHGNWKCALGYTNRHQFWNAIHTITRNQFFLLWLICYNRQWLPMKTLKRSTVPLAGSVDCAHYVRNVNETVIERILKKVWKYAFNFSDHFSIYRVRALKMDTKCPKTSEKIVLAKLKIFINDFTTHMILDNRCQKTKICSWFRSFIVK